MRKILIAIFFFILTIHFSCLSKNHSQHSSDISLNTDSLLIQERNKLKKYAFCKCMLNFKDSSSLYDGSLGGYIETGSYGGRAYELVDSFVLKQSRITYSSKYNKSLYTMRCLDIYGSYELDSLVNTFDKNIDLSR